MPHTSIRSTLCRRHADQAAARTISPSFATRRLVSSQRNLSMDASCWHKNCLACGMAHRRLWCAFFFLKKKRFRLFSSTILNFYFQNTIFVEVPLITFNPVKTGMIFRFFLFLFFFNNFFFQKIFNTVNDLLRKEHQPNSQE